LAIDVEFLVQSIISMVVITSPMDPIKVMFFNQAIADPPRNRTWAAGRVALYVALILGGTALAGRQLLDLIGIDLNAFSVVGGLIIALMGFEMLYGGGASKTQGEEQRQAGPVEGDALLIPLTLPLIAGPGAMTTTITIAASRDGSEGVTAALIGAGVVALIAFVAYALLSGVFTKIRPATMAVIARIGGLLLATIGVQMLLGGLGRFFG
jgi:multiple antibiotic resistance protein